MVTSTIERFLLSTDPKDPLYRLVVRRDSMGLYVAGQEDLTSRNPTAQVLESRCFVMTTEQATWMHRAIGEVLEEVYEEERTHSMQLLRERDELFEACRFALGKQMHGGSVVSEKLREAMAKVEDPPGLAEVVAIGKARAELETLP